MNLRDARPEKRSMTATNPCGTTVKIADAYGEGRFGLSFEIYPPKTEAGGAQLMSALDALMDFRPSFGSCTYGAGGSTRDKTLELVVKIRQTFGVGTAAHRTCVESPEE